jgi:hypothetical protein
LIIHANKNRAEVAAVARDIEATEGSAKEKRNLRDGVGHTTIRNGGGEEILAFRAKACNIFDRLMKRTSEEVAKTIEGFVDGTGRQWDWDGFTSIRIDDPELEAIRQKCIAVRDEFPPEKPGEYCSPAGMEAMRKLAGELRAHATA